MSRPRAINAATPSLADWQHGLQAYVLEHDDSISVALAEPCAIPAALRLAVYADAYVLRLLEVLGDDYSGLRKCLGEHRFEQLARAYIAVQPSDTHSVRWFGRHFAGFLRRRRTRPAWITELAEFEWLLGEVLDAADASPLKATDLAALPARSWPSIKLTMAASVRLLQLRWNTPELWQFANNPADKRKLPARRTVRPACCVLWRHAHEVRWRVLEQPEAMALRAMARGAQIARLGSALQRAGVANGQVSAQLVTVLQQWLADGLVSGLQAPAEAS